MYIDTTNTLKKLNIYNDSYSAQIFIISPILNLPDNSIFFMVWLMIV